jgi:4-methyl-5(b-hydroxyethyl)-thiazole monophosphate biosynthesis
MAIGVLVPLAAEFEELEAAAPIDLLRRAGAEVIVASLAETRWVTGRNGLRWEADQTLTEALQRTYDCVFLPGGPGVRHLRADSRLAPLLQEQSRRGDWIAAICAAPAVLMDAGLLDGRRFTAHFSVASELPDLLPGERTVTDGRLLTGRGAGTAIDFGLLLVAQLFSPAKAAEIAHAIGA